MSKVIGALDSFRQQMKPISKLGRNVKTSYGDREMHRPKGHPRCWNRSRHVDPGSGFEWLDRGKSECGVVVVASMDRNAVAHHRGCRCVHLVERFVRVVAAHATIVQIDDPGPVAAAG